MRDKLSAIVSYGFVVLMVGLFSFSSKASPILQVGAFNRYEQAQKMLNLVNDSTKKHVGIVTNETPIQSFHYVIVSGFDSLSEAKQEQVALGTVGISAVINEQDVQDKPIYQFSQQPTMEAIRVTQAYERLQRAILNPEYMLDNWIGLPIAPDDVKAKPFKLTMREAILLALRYNPDIQSEELNRITQRYQLRQAEFALELQYALTGNANFQKSTSAGIHSPGTQSYLLTPKLSLKTKWGTEYSLKIDNNYANGNTYNPVINFNIKQPLLRNFGPTVNEQNLLDAIDNEVSNKLNLKQRIIDQVTSVITTYRSVVQAGNTLKNTRRQLIEAIKLYDENKLKIKAGVLERTGNTQQAFQVEDLKLRVVESENSFKNAAVDLLQAIGLDPNMNIQVPSDTVLDNIFEPKLQATIDYALAHNTNYLTQQINMRRLERAYRVALNQQLWSLDFRGDMTTGTESGTGFDSHVSSLVNGRDVNKSINLQLTVPLNDVDLKARLIQAKVELENAKVKLIATKRRLIAQIRSSIYNIQALANAYQLAKKRVDLAQESFDIEVKRKNAGIASSLDVSNTQNQLLNAEIGLINAKINYLNQLALLEQTLATTLDKWNIKLSYVA